MLFKSWNNFGNLHADVWGNVSDWAMVLVTALTGFFVWKTLRSQMSVQKLMYREHKLKFYPELNIEFQGEGTLGVDPEYISYNFLKLSNIGTEHAFDIKIGDAPVGDNVEFLIAVHGDPLIEKNILAKDSVFLKIYNNQPYEKIVENPVLRQVMNRFSISGTFLFKDADGFPYRQKFSYWKSPGNNLDISMGPVIRI